MVQHVTELVKPVRIGPILDEMAQTNTRTTKSDSDKTAIDKTVTPPPAAMAASAYESLLSTKIEDILYELSGIRLGMQEAVARLS